MSRRGDRGQTAVEFALLLPVLALFALLIVQVGLVVRTQVLVTHAAREAVREAAVDDDPNAPRTAALAGAPLDADRLTVTVGPRGDTGSRVRVDLSYVVTTDVPLVGPLVADLTLHADATMRVE